MTSTSPPTTPPGICHPRRTRTPLSCLSSPLVDRDASALLIWALSFTRRTTWGLWLLAASCVSKGIVHVSSQGRCPLVATLLLAQRPILVPSAMIRRHQSCSEPLSRGPPGQSPIMNLSSAPTNTLSSFSIANGRRAVLLRLCGALSKEYILCLGRKTKIGFHM